MKFLANENFPLSSFSILQNKGYDIDHIGNTRLGITDEQVMGIAQTENRIIITFDADYGELVFKKGCPVKGVLYLRLHEFSPEWPAQIIHDIISNQTLTLEGFFTVVDENKMRQRKI
jgi:predicted nuclease of predicted toxin-antitoxin system